MCDTLTSSRKTSWESSLNVWSNYVSNGQGRLAIHESEHFKYLILSHNHVKDPFKVELIMFKAGGARCRRQWRYAKSSRRGQYLVLEGKKVYLKWDDTAEDKV